MFRFASLTPSGREVQGKLQRRGFNWRFRTITVLLSHPDDISLLEIPGPDLPKVDNRNNLGPVLGWLSSEEG